MMPTILSNISYLNLYLIIHNEGNSNVRTKLHTHHRIFYPTFINDCMASAKETVESILKSLPENATYEDIMYEIYVRRNIEKGLDDIKKGNVISEKEMNKWLQKWLK